jgi:hypothetical protein
MGVHPDQRNYLWQHFHFNAEQRLKAFNFFVVLSVFADGGAFTAVEKSFDPMVVLLIGGFLVILAIVFWLIDVRSKELLNLAIPGLKEFEEDLPDHARLFTIDARKPRWSARYTLAFRALIALQLVFGICVAGLGIKGIVVTKERVAIFAEGEPLALSASRTLSSRSSK